MDKNSKFVGTVNGKTYDNIQDYNKAFTDALGKKELVTASIEFKPANIEPEQTYDHCLPDFDLDELTGVAETDAPIIDDFVKQVLSADRIKDILDQAYKMNATDRAELDDDVKDMIKSIQVDIEGNNRAHTNLLKDMKRNEQEMNQISQEINEIRAKLDNLKKAKKTIQTQINITEGADRVLRSSLEFYDTLCKRLSRGRRLNDPNIKVTGRTTEKGNPGFILNHDQKEIAQKLIREILGI